MPRFRKRSYWVPSQKWQLVEWLLAWEKRTGRHIPNLKRKKKRELYAIYFSIMDEHAHRRPRGGKLSPQSPEEDGEDKKEE